eukprot:TRINITY_DN16894_c0_g1_i1.p1 TRINITY_DN16894_c0_g1~~TRINITY_DN16894_c0_g1_i1.p1  ORF type:complete len:362 (+),score=54.98 TRINITY_DN16894_c0_g1_i1:53-1087(+)
MSETLYVPKKILLTGGAGFIGSHVLIHLVKNYPDYTIWNLDKLDYCSSLKNLEEIKNHPNYHFVKGDILSSDLINHLLSSHKIDTIMHFAAQSHVDNSFGNSIAFTRNNILGTHVLLECAKVHNVKRFVHVSTDEVYGESSFGEGVKENCVLAPTNPYAASKAGAEHLVQSYYRSFRLPVIITRGNNVYGPHQYPEKIIPKFIGLLERGKPCCIHGNGSHKRSFIHVSDVVRAFDAILHKGAIGETYNIGTSFEISTLDVAKKLIAEFGLTEQESKYTEFVADRPFNDLRYAIDPSKLHQLGWKEQVSWDEGVKQTFAWYKRFKFENWDNAEIALKPHPYINVE